MSPPHAPLHPLLGERREAQVRSLLHLRGTENLKPLGGGGSGGKEPKCFSSHSFAADHKTCLELGDPAHPLPAPCLPGGGGGRWPSLCSLVLPKRAGKHAFSHTRALLKRSFLFVFNKMLQPHPPHPPPGALPKCCVGKVLFSFPLPSSSKTSSRGFIYGSAHPCAQPPAPAVTASTMAPAPSPRSATV